MTRCYLRVEGMNLAHFVYDTPDLSTIRGGGLLLLHAMEGLKNRNFKGVTLEPVRTGASVGLFSYETGEDGSPSTDKVVDAVRDHLNADANLKHATFVVAAIEAPHPAGGADSAFGRDLEHLIARNRWEQMRAPSVAFPSAAATWPCAVDKVRPATAKGLGKYRGDTLSASVAVRRRYGLQQKQAFYGEILGSKPKKLFASEFEQIGEDTAKQRGPLGNKIALIYVDGNGFGKVQQELCKSPKQQRSFDKQLQSKRKEFLKALLQHLITDPGFLHKGKGRNHYRLETLLWGGDEFMLVVPAWRGWDTLAFFFEFMNGWKVTVRPEEGQEEPREMYHAAGLVFCKVKSPIHRVEALARGLCDIAKADRNRSLFSYVCLESFDVLPVDLAGHRDTLVPDLPAAGLNLDGTKMGEIAEQIAVLKDADFPRRKLFDLAKGRLDDAAVGELLDDVSDEARDAAGKLKALLTPEARWYHLAELWDYAGKGEATPWLK